MDNLVDDQLVWNQDANIEIVRKLHGIEHGSVSEISVSAQTLVPACIGQIIVQTENQRVSTTDKEMHYRILFNTRGDSLLYMRPCAVIILIIISINAEANHHVKERQINAIPLVYPYGAIYKLLIGFASPVATKDKINLLFGVNFQYQYAQFTNITQLSPHYFIKTVSRESRDAGGREDERLVFYRSVAELLNSKGMNGPVCVLRAVCEAAQFPVEKEGFVGEILHVLLTPDYGRSPFDDDPASDLPEMTPYIDAAVAGRQMFSCAAIYDDCPEGEGLMELISTIRDD